MPAPSHLYKYQALTAHSLASCVNETVWLSQPKTFNDPFDCALTLDRAKYKESVMHAVSVAIELAKPAGLKPEHLLDIWPGDKEAFEEYREKLKSKLQELGIFCLSADSCNLLMWSHYANHHRGFCIEYDCSEETLLRRIAFEVRYKDMVPSVSAADLSGPDKGNALDSLWLTKARCWEYEQEWRVMMPEGGKPFRSPSKITSIIFGARIVPV